jgi:hypothetical protein
MQVAVRRIHVATLPAGVPPYPQILPVRHADDGAPADPHNLIGRTLNVANVLQHLRAQDRIEIRIAVGQIANVSLHAFHAWYVGRFDQVQGHNLIESLSQQCGIKTIAAARVEDTITAADHPKQRPGANLLPGRCAVGS